MIKKGDKIIVMRSEKMQSIISRLMPENISHRVWRKTFVKNKKRYNSNCIRNYLLTLLIYARNTPPRDTATRYVLDCVMIYPYRYTLTLSHP